MKFSTLFSMNSPCGTKECSVYVWFKGVDREFKSLSRYYTQTLENMAFQGFFIAFMETFKISENTAL